MIASHHVMVYVDDCVERNHCLSCLLHCDDSSVAVTVTVPTSELWFAVMVIDQIAGGREEERGGNSLPA